MKYIKLRNISGNICGQENDYPQVFFSRVTNLPKLMMAQTDFTENQITGRLLYRLSDGFINEAVISTMRLAGRNVPFFWWLQGNTVNTASSPIQRGWVGHGSDLKTCM